MLIHEYLDLKEKKLRVAKYYAVLGILVYLTVILIDYPLFYSSLPIRGFVLVLIILVIDISAVLYIGFIFFRLYLIKATHDIRFSNSNGLQKSTNSDDKHLVMIYGVAENDETLMVDTYSLRGSRVNRIITLDKQKDDPAILKRFEKGRQILKRRSQTKWFSFMIKSAGDMVYYDQRTW